MLLRIDQLQVDLTHAAQLQQHRPHVGLEKHAARPREDLLQRLAQPSRRAATDDFQRMAVDRLDATFAISDHYRARYLVDGLHGGHGTCRATP
jgi:hypothetical protein